ncbi:MAG TPA: L-threonylcarbamoyladenylate synthase [Candidatus Didemnitutus sp.]|nr:L-threonylcarbamoyladenylate synthase [Candidatus Didemnitutus sp.]
MPAKIHQPTPRAIRALAARLRRGGLVAIPTETVYGLAANALDARACRSIFRAKRRPADDPLIVHVVDLRAAESLAVFNEPARVLVRAFWPGPLTLVLPRKSIVPAVVTSGQSTVALRSPAHPVARRLLRAAGIPLAAPSANLFGYVSPTTAEHVLAGLGGRIDAILDGGPCRVGVESTIATVTADGAIRVLRPGAISGASLVQALRRAGIRGRLSREKPARTVLAPGLLDQHYSPSTPLEVRTKIASSLTRSGEPHTAYIFRRRPRGRIRRGIFSFSRTGSAREVARHLYRVLREVDAAGFRKIVAESMPVRAGDPLAVAINDRLLRAAGRRR